MISRSQQHWHSRYWHHSYYCWSSYSRHDFPSRCWSCSRYNIILSLVFKVKCLSSAICKELQSILINYCGVLRSYYTLSLSRSLKFVWTVFVCLRWKEDRSGPTATNIGVLEEHLLLDSHSQYVLLLWASLSLTLGSVAGSSECWK
jgi:hypothetical protein